MVVVEEKVKMEVEEELKMEEEEVEEGIKMEAMLEEEDEVVNEEKEMETEEKEVKIEEVLEELEEEEEEKMIHLLVVIQGRVASSDDQNTVSLDICWQ